MSATRLTETQWMVLSAASQRDDHCAILPPRLRGGAAQKVVKKLLDLGLVEAVRARGDVPVWRREDDGGPMALRLTSRGLERIQALRGELGPKEQDRVLEQEVGAKTEEKVFSPRGRLAATGGPEWRQPPDVQLAAPALAPSRRGSSPCYSAPRARPFRPSWR
jgi:hypothetical protein